MTRADAGRLASNVALLIGLLGVVALAIVALFGSSMTPSDPQAQRLVLFFPDGVVGTAQKLIARIHPGAGAGVRQTGRPDEGQRPEEAKPQSEVPPHSGALNEGQRPEEAKPQSEVSHIQAR